MKNRLISDSKRESYLLNEGRCFPEYRCSGRTTAIALSLLGEAMENPGRWVKRCDHHKGYSARNARLVVSKLAMCLAEKLELKFFELDSVKGEIRYNVYGIYP